MALEGKLLLLIENNVEGWNLELDHGLFTYFSSQPVRLAQAEGQFVWGFFVLVVCIAHKELKPVH